MSQVNRPSSVRKSQEGDDENVAGSQSSRRKSQTVDDENVSDRRSSKQESLDVDKDGNLYFRPSSRLQSQRVDDENVANRPSSVRRSQEDNDYEKVPSRRSSVRKSQEVEDNENVADRQSSVRKSQKGDDNENVADRPRSVRILQDTDDNENVADRPSSVRKSQKGDDDENVAPIPSVVGKSQKGDAYENVGYRPSSVRKTLRWDDDENVAFRPEGTKYDFRSSVFRKKKPRKLFMTREIARYFDRETYLKVSLKEMLIFFGFIITLSVLSSPISTMTQYFYTNALTGIFIDWKFPSYTGEILSFNDINSMDHIWPYIDYVLLENFYWTNWYVNSMNKELSADDQNILYSNKIIGEPRMKQVRVQNNSCEIPDDFKLMFTSCYAEYSKNAEERKPFGPRTGTAWTFTDAKTLGSDEIIGEISTYGGGGYYVDFAKTRNESFVMIKNLRDNLWIDRATRFIVVVFATYNANINYFCFVKLLFELPATGGVIPSYEISTYLFLPHPDFSNVIQWIFMIIFCVYCLLFLVEEIYEIIYFKWQYIKTFWNWYDLMLIVICAEVILAKLIKYVYTNAKLTKLIDDKDSQTLFDELLNVQKNYDTGLSILLFLSWIKFVKYLAINNSMYQMQSTLSRAAADILCFSVIFFTVYIAFAELGHLLFGSQVAEFRTFGKSLLALLRTVVGDFDYQAIENANHFLGPIYFFSYIFFIFFILVNMFLAIINDTYSEVHSEIFATGMKTHLADVIILHFYKIMRKLGLGKLADNWEFMANREIARCTYQEIRNMLERCGFTEMDIDLFFAKYEITEDRLISPPEMRKILSNVEELAPLEDEAFQIYQDVELTKARLEERITDLEDAAIDADNKIDIILCKLDGLQQMKLARRSVPAEQKRKEEDKAEPNSTEEDRTENIRKEDDGTEGNREEDKKS